MSIDYMSGDYPIQTLRSRLVEAVRQAAKQAYIDCALANTNPLKDSAPPDERRLNAEASAFANVIADAIRAGTFVDTFEKALITAYNAPQSKTKTNLTSDENPPSQLN